MTLDHTSSADLSIAPASRIPLCPMCFCGFPASFKNRIERSSQRNWTTHPLRTVYHTGKPHTFVVLCAFVVSSPSFENRIERSSQRHAPHILCRTVYHTGKPHTFVSYVLFGFLPLFQKSYRAILATTFGPHILCRSVYRTGKPEYLCVLCAFVVSSPSFKNRIERSSQRHWTTHPVPDCLSHRKAAIPFVSYVLLWFPPPLSKIISRAPRNDLAPYVTSTVYDTRLVSKTA